MAQRYTQRNSAAVADRPRVGRIVLLAVLGALLLALLLVVLRLLTRDRGDKAPAAEPAPTAEAQSPETAPPVEETAPETTPGPALPNTSGELPADPSPELAARAALRRDGFPLLTVEKDKLIFDEKGRVSYTGDIPTAFGIDVSEHQGDIDWSKVAADGVEFVMIRLGRRGSTAGGLFEDEYFKTNIEGARKAGLDVGVYFYSQAVTPAEAQEEADYVLAALKPYRIDGPVVFDWEIVGAEEARTYTVSRRMLCDCASAFCDAVAEAGYTPMIYFTRYLGYRKYILRELTDYGFWYAEYEPTPTFSFDFDMWQYSDTGYVDGIEGAVDLNILFKNGERLKGW